MTETKATYFCCAEEPRHNGEQARKDLQSAQQRWTDSISNRVTQLEVGDKARKNALDDIDLEIEAIFAQLRAVEERLSPISTGAEKSPKMHRCIFCGESVNDGTKHECSVFKPLTNDTIHVCVMCRGRIPPDDLMWSILDSRGQQRILCTPCVKQIVKIAGRNGLAVWDE
jgi:hypothetical protein